MFLQRDLRMLIGIIVVAAFAFFVAAPGSPGFHFNLLGLQVDQDFPIHQGLDLKGGVQVLLQADVPAGTKVDPVSMQAAQQIVTQRVDALGVSEPEVQQASGNRIIVQLPGIKNPDAAVQTFSSSISACDGVPPLLFTAVVFVALTSLPNISTKVPLGVSSCTRLLLLSPT